VRADDPLRPVDDLGDVRDGERGGVRRQDGPLRCHLVEVREDVVLEVEVLGGGLDDDVGVRDGRLEVRRGLDAVQHVGGRLLEAALLGELLQGPLDVLVAALDEVRLDVLHRDVVARDGHHLRDAVSHAPRAEHRHAVDVLESHTDVPVAGINLRLPQLIIDVRLFTVGNNRCKLQRPPALGLQGVAPAFFTSEDIFSRT
jgi:hypothetical protein